MGVRGYQWVCDEVSGYVVRVMLKTGHTCLRVFVLKWCSLKGREAEGGDHWVCDKGYTYLLEEGEHAQGDHVLPEVVPHLEDEACGHGLQRCVVNVGHLQPLGLL